MATTEAQKRAKEKYDKENTKGLYLKLNTKTDADILDWLEGRQKQTVIKEAIREMMGKERKMNKMTVYANYGILGHEKEPVYNTRCLSSAVVSDLVEIEIPEELEVVVNEYDETMINLYGTWYPLDKVLGVGADDQPILEWHDGKAYHRLRLQ